MDVRISNIEELLDIRYNALNDDDKEVIIDLLEIDIFTPFLMCFWKSLMDDIFKLKRYSHSVGPKGLDLIFKFSSLLNGNTNHLKKYANEFEIKLEETTSLPLLHFKADIRLSEQGKLRKKLLDFVKNQVSIEYEVSYLIYHGLKEIIDNSYAHSHSNFGCHACALIEKLPEKINICILDRGIGILNSLLKKYPDITDSCEAINESLKLKISRYDDPDRGRGLYTLLHSIKKNNGRLSIISGNGCFIYDGSKDKKEKCSVLKKTFPGTIIDISINNDPDYLFSNDLMEEIL